MTTPGYPDYARLSQAGNRRLAFISGGSIANNQVLFSGYVGSWPYTSIALNIGATADAIKILMQYYSDNTFTNQVGFRFIIRNGAQFSSICYGNLSEWMLIFAVTQSGNPIPIVNFGVYGTEGYAPREALDSMDVPLLRVTSSVPAGTTQQFAIQHVHPGNARLLVFSAATSWNAQMFYYDYGSNSILQLYQQTLFGAAGTYEGDYPQIDAPMYVSLRNAGAAAATMTATVLAK